MAFSGALTLTDLNDFITPSQACIKPVTEINAPTKNASQAATEIHIDSSGAYYEVSSSKETTEGRKLEQAQINLNDCLACSGCITSAESVLITLQSHIEVLAFVDANPPADQPGHRIPVMSIAPQVLASLAASVTSASISPRQMLRRVRSFCRANMGFEAVFDTTFARHLALKDTVTEWQQRRNAARTGDIQGVDPLPMIASACPGWICYAEKAHAEMLPYISKTKSPQQVMGTLVKQWMGERCGAQPNDIYHLSVMPCYDKKLEASRQDFLAEHPHEDVREVDCVITSGEFEGMLRSRGWDPAAAVADENSSVGLEGSDSPLSEDTQRLIREKQSPPKPCSKSSGSCSCSKAVKTNGNPASTDKSDEHAEAHRHADEHTHSRSNGQDRDHDHDHDHAHGHHHHKHRSPAANLPKFEELLPELLVHPGTSSGSYLHAIIAHLMQETTIPLQLELRKGRNDDFVEYILRRPAEPAAPGEVLFKGAKCYGFRNLQNLVRKVGKTGRAPPRRVVAKRAAVKGVQPTGDAEDGKAAKPSIRDVVARRRAAKNGGVAADDAERDRPYDYVEVMACPGGCVNGGGQIKPTRAELPSEAGTGGLDVDGQEAREARWGDKEWTRKVEELYWVETPEARDTAPRDGAATLSRADELAEGILATLTPSEAERLLRTQYRAVEPDPNSGFAAQW
ncbi:iron hydrogenase [Schizophyllum amplum]|uniref:Iron hydrogenase n=1 Tax=Schizophyllum amplum TaxID=97359 RepID=A0A550CZ34_9AGAR|nr:iron hydrogenase [Auriculariopsis ampla]